MRWCITAVRSEDCGPCTQLAVTMAERQGVSPEILRALLNDDESAMSEEVALAWRFTLKRRAAASCSMRSAVAAAMRRACQVPLSTALTVDGDTSASFARS